MRRRELLAAAATIPTAGCTFSTGTEDDEREKQENDNTQRSKLSSDSRVSRRYTKLNNIDNVKPLNIVQLVGIEQHSDSSINFRLLGSRLYDYTIRIYRHTPTIDSPGDFGIEFTYKDTRPERYDENIRTFIPYGLNSSKKHMWAKAHGFRTVIKYPEDSGELIAEAKVPNRQKQINSNNLKDDGFSSSGNIHRMLLSTNTMRPKTGVPITYSVEIEEDILNEFGPRKVSWSQQVVRDAYANYRYAPRNQHDLITDLPYKYFNYNSRNEISNGKRVSFGRISGYSPFSDKDNLPLTRKERIEYAVVSGTDDVRHAHSSRSMKDRRRVRPFSISIDVTEKELNEATEFNRLHSNDIDGIVSMSQSNFIMQHPPVKRLISKLTYIANSINATKTFERVRLASWFVQCFTYAFDIGEYPKTPTETIYTERGDCEDATLLLFAILKSDFVDINPHLAYIEDVEPDIVTPSQRGKTLSHISVFAPLNIQPGKLEVPWEENLTKFTIDGKELVYVECTRPKLIGSYSFDESPVLLE